MLKRNNLFSLIKEKKKQFLKNKKLFIMVLIGVSGMLLILLSELFSNDGESVQKNTDSTAEVAGISSTYKDKIQEELLKVISKIDGVGDVDILLTVDGTTEYIYAEDLVTSSDKNDGSQSDDYSGKTVIIDDNGNEKPLIKKIVEPSVTGVLVVCSGGDRYEIIEKVSRAVSTALNIPRSSVCVVKG